jgi:hypothetical protein
VLATVLVLATPTSAISLPWAAEAGVQASSGAPGGEAANAEWAAGTTVAAEEAPEPGARAATGFRGGGKLGAAVTWFSGSDWNAFLRDTYESADADFALFRFIGGGYGTYYLFPWLGIGIEVFYSQLGAGYEYEYEDVDLSVRGTFRVNVLETPLLLKARLPVGSAFVYLSAGPDLFVLPGNVEYREKLTAEDPIPDSVRYLKPENRAAWGAAASLGGMIPAGPGHVDIEVRYARMFSTFLGEKGFTKVYANGASLLVGYGLGL